MATIQRKPSGGGASYVMTQDGRLYELTSDYSAAFDRPDLFYSITDFSRTRGGTFLLALTYDGRMFGRSNNATSPWFQFDALPFDVMAYDEWVGLVPSPVSGGGGFFAITSPGRWARDPQAFAGRPIARPPPRAPASAR